MDKQSETSVDRVDRASRRLVWESEPYWVGTRKPVERAETLRPEAYHDQAFFDTEQDRVFKRGWVGIALVDDLTPGRLLVRKVGGQSLLLTRDKSGDLRAFHNSCRHRGTELAEQDCAVEGIIRCPYHRWGYNLEGTLVSTPRFDEVDVEDFDRDAYGLHPVQIDEWECLVFVCLADNPPPLSDWLGDLPARTHGYGLESWRIHETRSLKIEANWKLIAENYQEYYHLPWVHPDLSKVSRVQDHYRFQGSGMYCGQTTTPVTSVDRNDWTMLPASDGREGFGLNKSDAVSGRFLSIFPNVLLSILPNHAFVLMLEPVGPGLTVETCTWLIPSSTPTVSDEGFSATRDFWLEVNNEDIDIVQRSQRGLRSGTFTQGRLSPRFEEPLHRFHNMLADRFVGLDRVPEGDPNDSDERLGTGKNPHPYAADPSVLAPTSAPPSLS